MDTYSLLRTFADSWALLLLFAIFVFVVIWVWRPGSRRAQKDAATSIFRNETKPATGTEHDESRAPADRKKEA